MPFLSALGNTPIDLIATAPDALLTQFGVTKGTYNKVEDDHAMAILTALPTSPVILPGGGVSNATACYATLGGQAAFTGPLVLDKWGRMIADDLQGRGVTLPHPGLSPDTFSTKRILCLMTPDGERSFIGLPGGGAVFDSTLLCPNTLSRSDFILLDGYILRRPETLQAFQTACDCAISARTGLMPGSVTMLHDYAAYLDPILARVDALFLNAVEAQFLCGTEDMAAIFRQLPDRYACGSVTLGADGAFVFANGQAAHIPVTPASGTVIDTNGAGDAFAGGFLYGLQHGYALPTAGQIGAACAAAVITRVGARLPRDFVLPDNLTVV